MFNRGVEALLQALPDLPGLSVDQIRRLLTQAWLDATDLRASSIEDQPEEQRPQLLRRLATALEVYAILPPDVDAASVRACAFVAAEALAIAHERAPLAAQREHLWLFGSTRKFEQVEVGLLYLIAGYDANAALTDRGLGRPEPEANDLETPAAQWALGVIRVLLTLRGSLAEQPSQLLETASLRSKVRHAIWIRIGTYVADHIRWLRFESVVDPRAAAQLRALADLMEPRHEQPIAGVAQHPDLHHLSLLLAAACDATSSRSLHTVPPPDGDAGRFRGYQRRRAGTRPLLWPGALDYATATLPGPSAHAVVSVPTGAGKSSVAELAIAQALHRGWVLYLAPTNALVNQIRRHNTEVFGGRDVKGFIGGAEYTNLAGESLADIEDRQVLVMTPEKCSLVLRQNPDAFARLSLCILDEAHILGDGNERAIIAELVLAEIMHRAPGARLLLLSALVANPRDVADWLEAATDTPAVVIDEPWRPTRTLRAIAGLDQDRLSVVRSAALGALDQMPPRRKNQNVNVPIALLAGLQGAWSSLAAEDYNLVRTDIDLPMTVNRDTRDVATDGYVNPLCEALVQALGERGDRVLAFLPKSKHYSFMISSRMAGFAAQPFTLDVVVEALLTLAEFELGIETELRTTLGKRIAVHTSALLSEEQRASEVAFEKEDAVALFATGTMAQGLNLPATAVVIGGTDIGYDNQASFEEKEQRERTQLLNAIGRAGRAHVASRSIAIVVPNKAVRLTYASTPLEAVRSAGFLREEDASSTIVSALDGLITAATRGALSVDALSDSEQTAFSFLSFAGGPEAAEPVVAKTWAVHRANAQQYATQIAGDISRLGRTVMLEEGAPSWIAIAAHRSGIELSAAIRLERSLRTRLSVGIQPQSIVEWAKVMISVLKTFPAFTLKQILPSKPFGNTSQLSAIYADDDEQRSAGWQEFELALAAWMMGKPLIQIAERIHNGPVSGNAGRKATDPLPRTIVAVSQGFGYGLSLIAGAIAAIVSTGSEEDPFGTWSMPEQSLRQLMLLPLGVRLGAANPTVIALIRAGVQPRVVAHRLSRYLAAPEGQCSDDQLLRWARRRYSELIEGTATTKLPDALIELVEALGVVRGLR